MRTRLSVCQRKRRFASAGEAIALALGAGLDLRPYRCDRCRRYHLTGRTKGKRPLSQPGATERPCAPASAEARPSFPPPP